MKNPTKTRLEKSTTYLKTKKYATRKKRKKYESLVGVEFRSNRISVSTFRVTTWVSAAFADIPMDGRNLNISNFINEKLQVIYE